MNKEMKARVRSFPTGAEVMDEEMFNCIELQEEGHRYGNGKHVVIVKQDGTLFQHLDVRHVVDYEFIDCVVSQFAGFYGPSLRQVEVFVEESKDFNVCVFNKKYNERS